MTQHQLVKIVWKDAFAGPQEWTSLKDYNIKPVEPCTVGWLIPDVLEGYVTTADTIYVDEDGEYTYYNIGHIPNGMVLSIEVIEKPDKLNRKLSKKKGK